LVSEAVQPAFPCHLPLANHFSCFQNVPHFKKKSEFISAPQINIDVIALLQLIA
jgi:hypothetical protein